MSMYTLPVEQELFNMQLKASRPMSELQFFAAELSEWEFSDTRREMIDGERYYNGDHDIMHRKRMAIGKDGNLQEVKNLPNNKIVDNLYSIHADKKTNYIVGKPIAYQAQNDKYVKNIENVLNARFFRTLKNSVLGSLLSGIDWLFPYFNAGELTFKRFPGFEILPFWKDTEHTELDCALRIYEVEVYEGSTKKIIKKVDIFKLDGVQTCVYDGGTLRPENDIVPYVTMRRDANEQALNWAKIPLIAIKSNAKEIPLLRRCRGIQDAINLLESDFTNNMQENDGTTILKIKNYDGQDLGEFRQNLATYRAVKVRSFDGNDGDVDTLNIEVNSENYKTILDLLKRSLIENVRSYDAKDERMSGNPNQMNIQSMYSDIDLDANGMETELQAAFEEILWFVNVYLQNANKAEADEKVKVIFNRDILINESEAIDNCSKSTGIISDETIIANHPWVDNPNEEMARFDKQRQQENENRDPYNSVFGGEKQ